MAANGCCGRTFRELFPQTKEMTLDTFLDQWSKGMFLSLRTDGKTQESVSQKMGTESWSGGCWTLNTSESLNDAVESSLYSVLEHGGGYPPVLFESESMSRDSEKSKRTQQSLTSSLGEDPSENGCIEWNARDIRGSRVTENSMDHFCATQFKGAPLNGYKADAISTGDFIGVGKDVCPTLTRRDYKDPNVVGYPEKSSVCVDDFRQNCVDAGVSIIDGKEYEKAIAIRTANTKSNGNGILKDQAHTVACTQPEVVAYRPDSTSSNSMKSPNPNSGFHKKNVCCTLDTSDQGETRCNELVCEKQKVPILNFQGSKGNSIAEESNTMYTLNAMHGHDVHCIVDFQGSLFDD